MPREVWGRVLREAASYAHTMQFYFQGEPLLNKDLPQMVSEAHEAGLYTIVSTNAQAMTPEMAESLVKAGLSRIIVSMDGLTDESYGAYRIGGILAQCKAALGYLRDAKQRLHGRTLIELQVLRLRTNEHEWEEFKRQYRLFGADRLVFKTAQLYDYADGHPLMPSDPRYSRYVQGTDGKYHRRKLRKGCFRVWSGVVVTTKGDVLPCCYDKSHAYPYGNIMDTPLADLFTNDKAMAFRKAAMNEQPSICKECWR
jgi:radical SAM protein with 4Fe4S-binding SPASM domain